MVPFFTFFGTFPFTTSDLRLGSWLWWPAGDKETSSPSSTSPNTAKI